MPKNRRVEGWVATVTLLAGLLTMPDAANADVAATLYVDRTSSACSDSGTGSQIAPFCTIGAATALVEPGQTVSIKGYGYTEDATLTRSGTPSAPITITGVDGHLLGSVTFSLSGVHDVALRSVRMQSTTGSSASTGMPAILLKDSSRLVVDHVVVVSILGTGSTGIELDDVTDSSVTNSNSAAAGHPAVSIDSASSHVTLDRVVASARKTTTAQPSGIDVAGDDVAIVRGLVAASAHNGVQVEPDASNVSVVRTSIGFNTVAAGIEVLGGSGFTAVNNTISQVCGSGISIATGTTGVTIENNLIQAAAPVAGCVTPAEPVAIGIYGDATQGAVVDFNNLHSPIGGPYAWGTSTPIATVAAFQEASGQGSHDLDATTAAPYDSANSAAPGYVAMDRSNHVPEDDPSTPNTGPGPIAYADRGAGEVTKAPIGALTINPTVSNGQLGVTADASSSIPGWAPITSYTFSWGDGTTTTQSTAVASHIYPSRQNFAVTVTISDAKTFGFARSSLYATFASATTSLANAVTVPAGGTTTVALAGSTSIATSQTLALDVFVRSGGGSGALTAYDHGSARPTNPTVRFGAQQTVSTIASVPVTGSSIDLYNASSQPVTASITETGSWQATSTFTTVHTVTPIRIFDTPAMNRDARLTPGQTISFNTIPQFPNESAQIYRITTLNATAAGGLKVLPTGATAASFSDLVAVQPGIASSNLVVSPASLFSIINDAAGKTDVTIDLVGYLAYADSGLGGVYTPGPNTTSRITVAPSKPAVLHLSVPLGAKYAFIHIGVVSGNAGVATVSAMSSSFAYDADHPVDQWLVVPVTASPLHTGMVYQANLNLKATSSATLTLQILGYQGVG